MTLQFVWGALTMASAMAGLLFLRFWRTSKDRLLLIFAAAFWVMSLTWLALSLAGPADETHHYYYVGRLVAFTLIIFGIAQKNRRGQ